MTALVYTLHRHRDVSGVSGEGAVATAIEFDDGHAVLHWDSATPSTTVYTDIRHITALHGHSGASTLELLDKDRLLRAWTRVMQWMLSARYADRPVQCAPHPDHPDRLRLIFLDERVWRWWIALFDGSTDTATHVEVDGEMQHQWIDPEGDLWLIHYTPTATSSDPEEDR